MHLFHSDHLETVCPSCREKHHGNWESKWWMREHYISLICHCGYKIIKKTGHDHSGHHH